MQGGGTKTKVLVMGLGLDTRESPGPGDGRWSASVSFSYCGEHGRVPSRDVHRGCPAGTPAVVVKEAEGKGASGPATRSSLLWLWLVPVLVDIVSPSCHLVWEVSGPLALLLLVSIPHPQETPRIHPQESFWALLLKSISNIIYILSENFWAYVGDSVVCWHKKNYIMFSYANFFHWANDCLVFHWTNVPILLIILN